MHRRIAIDIVGGVNLQPMASGCPQNDADGINPEIVVNFMGDFTDQFIKVQLSKARRW
jgi:hypothetical protein